MHMYKYCYEFFRFLPDLFVDVQDRAVSQHDRVRLRSEERRFQKLTTSKTQQRQRLAYLKNT